MISLPHLRAVVAGLFIALLIASPGHADGLDGLDARIDYCNDSYFNSDGAGITTCLDAAVRKDGYTGGISLVGATPEQNVRGINDDPMKSISRISGWFGTERQGGELRYGLTLRAGIQGGAADDIFIDLHDLAHSISGAKSKPIESTEPTTFIAGASGWLRRDYGLAKPWILAMSFTPYSFGSAGNDVIEWGAGAMLAVQPPGAEAFQLMLPQNGAYVPTFGGDGIAVYADARVVPLESLYGDLAEQTVAEAGAAAQVTLFHRTMLGASAFCSTIAYDGADPDCRANLMIGTHF